MLASKAMMVRQFPRSSQARRIRPQTDEGRARWCRADSFRARNWRKLVGVLVGFQHDGLGNARLNQRLTRSESVVANAVGHAEQAGGEAGDDEDQRKNDFRLPALALAGFFR